MMRNRILIAAVGVLSMGGVAAFMIAPTLEEPVEDFPIESIVKFPDNLTTLSPMDYELPSITKTPPPPPPPPPAPEPEPEPEPVVETPPAPQAAPPYTGGGSKAEWMAAAGIPESDWGSVDVLINRESSWNPDALNASSGACGLVQALPCSKIPGTWNNPVDALTWGNSYVNSRYGSWANALAHSHANGWY